jgi:hypothetical protein
MRWIAAALLLAGCESMLGPSQRHCGPALPDFPDGYTCPSGLACSSGPPYCGAPDPNLAACTGQPEHSDCVTTAKTAGVCLTPMDSTDRVCTECTADIAWCKTPGWSSMTAPSGFTFGSVWASGLGDAYIGISPVGADLVGMLHYDGTQWSKLDVQPPVIMGSHVTSIWGTSPTDIYAVNDASLSHFDGMSWQKDVGPKAPMTSVWGANGRLYVAGPGGFVAYFDGTWHKSTAIVGAMPLPTYKAVWTDGSRAYAVGVIMNGTATTGAIGYFDGNAWTATAWAKPLYGVWSAYAVGDGNASSSTILDLSAGNATGDPGAASLPIADLTSIWGSAPDDVFACGRKGTIFHYGTTWTSQPPLSGNPDLVQVEGSSAADVFAISASGVWRYGGN